MTTFRFDLNKKYSKKLEKDAADNHMGIQEYIRYKLFGSDEKVCEWIKTERLDCFFEGTICRESIIDLAGTGDVKNGLPDDLNILLRNYIHILMKRQ